MEVKDILKMFMFMNKESWYDLHDREKEYIDILNYFYSESDNINIDNTQADYFENHQSIRFGLFLISYIELYYQGIDFGFATFRNDKIRRRMYYLNDGEKLNENMYVGFSDSDILYFINSQLTDEQQELFELLARKYKFFKEHELDPYCSDSQNLYNINFKI